MGERLLIGVDPGKACGFAVLDDMTLSSDDLTVYEACTKLERLLAKKRPTIVAVERFTFQASSVKKTRQYDALEFIGVARYMCTKVGIPLLIQGAADASRIGSPEVLRALGWWKKGHDHANKAAAQVALAFAKTHPKLFEEMLRPGIVN